MEVRCYQEHPWLRLLVSGVFAIHVKRFMMVVAGLMATFLTETRGPIPPGSMRDYLLSSASAHGTALSHDEETPVAYAGVAYNPRPNSVA